jgi:hypothetical protein
MGKSARRYRPWRTLSWMAFWLVLGQTATIGLLEWKHPGFLDPKYGVRLESLRAEVARAPGRPLAVVLGTSRAEQGFRPGLLHDSMQLSGGPVVFNLARGGSSPLLHLVTLRRLVADGVRPDRVLLEIFPPSLVEPTGVATLSKPTLRDLPILRRYPVSPQTYALFLRDRLLLWYRYRSSFLAHILPEGISLRQGWIKRLWDSRGGEWQSISEGAAPQERAYRTADARRRYFSRLQHFRIGRGADRALRELLTLCREEGIEVVLFLMPESSEFRGWYPPPAREHLSEYLDSLRRDYVTPLIDARDWVADGEFWDGHHLLRGGAEVFTRRFAAAALPRKGKSGQFLQSSNVNARQGDLPQQGMANGDVLRIERIEAPLQLVKSRP